MLAQLAALTTGSGLNLANAQAWPGDITGEITWDLVVGTNTIRFAAPLSASLENENFTLSLACDSYSIAQTDAAIATALGPYETAAQRDAVMSGLIAAALLHYSTTGQMNAAIASAVGAIDLSGYYTSAHTDAAITAALVPVALNNAPDRRGRAPTCCGTCTSRGP